GRILQAAPAVGPVVPHQRAVQGRQRGLPLPRAVQAAARGPLRPGDADRGRPEHGPRERGRGPALLQGAVGGAVQGLTFHTQETQPMKPLLGSLALLGGLALVLPAPAADEEKAGPKDNTPPPGFTALFNGKDLKGWQSVIPLPERAKLLKKGREALDARIKAETVTYLKHWTIKHGVLVFDGKRGGRSLQTVKDYGNFELYVDWKIPPKGDSGIYLRGNPQVQIWDSDTLPDSLKRDRGKGSGGL